jgi:hypothetical protein
MRLILVATILCAGCGLAHEAQLERMLSEKKATCQNLFPDPHLKPASQRVKCMNDAVIDVAMGDPNADLLRTLAARRLVVAERYDGGQLTAAEFDAEMAALESDANTSAQERQNSSIQANAAATQAALAQSRAVQSAFHPTTTCQTFGNTTTCR